MPQRHLEVPPNDVLAGLFRERRPRSVGEVAALVGWPGEQVEREAKDRDALLPDGSLAWSEAASWALESWPLAMLFRSLASHANLLPAGLRLVPVPLELPAYLDVALRVQAEIEPMPHRRVRPATFEDYMIDLLHRAIDERTVEALKDQDEFMRAYHFPEAVP